MSDIEFSIVIVTYRGTTQLRELYRSLEAALDAVPQANSEVITIVNGAAPSLEATIAEYSARAQRDGVPLAHRAGIRTWEFLQLRESTTPPQARNHGLKQASGKWIVYLDDDILLPAHYFSTLLKAATRQPAASVIGGPNLNPPNSSPFENATGRILGSRLITGPFASRYAARGAPKITRGDWRFILCNLAVKRSSAKLFAADMPLGEENALLLDLGSDGQRFLFVPELHVFHRRRPTQKEFLKQMLKYGRGRGLLLRKYGLKAPSNFGLGTALLALAALVAAKPALAVAFYASLVLGVAGFTAARDPERAKTFPLALIAILICHIFYPAGCVLGFFSAINKKAHMDEHTPASAFASDAAAANCRP